MRRSPATLALTIAIAFAIGTSFASAADAAKRYRDGDMVPIRGAVTDGAGQPIAGVQLRLEASRSGISITRMRKLLYNPVVVGVETDSLGQFRIDWKWHRYYNHFVLSAIVPLRKPGGEVDERALVTENITLRVEQGATTLAPLVIADTSLLDAVRAFEAEIDSDDERRVYTEQGKPDRVEVVDYADRQEEAWWYFEHGEVYRFTDGRLVGSDSFEPVPGIGREPGS